MGMEMALQRQKIGENGSTTSEAFNLNRPTMNGDLAERLKLMKNLSDAKWGRLYTLLRDRWHRSA